VANAENRVLAASLIAVAASLQLVSGVPAWSVCLDVGRRNVGVVTGFMNTVGNLGGALAPIVTGYMVARWGSWTIPFYATASVLAGGVVMWLIVDPQRSVIDELDS
jgi:ACS family glucarate transporter-like MFS transporter